MVGVYVDWIWTQYRRRSGQIPVVEMVAFLGETYKRSVDMGLLLDWILALQ